jgi:steroid 5-alpha reductase family enzyme
MKISKLLSVLLIFLSLFIGIKLGAFMYLQFLTRYQFDLTIELCVFIFNVMIIISNLTFTWFYNNLSFLDLFWSFGVVAKTNIIALHFLNEKYSFKCLIIIVLINIWGLRLASLWIKHWPGLPHVDWRYDEVL